MQSVLTINWRDSSAESELNVVAGSDPARALFSSTSNTTPDSLEVLLPLLPPTRIEWVLHSTEIYQGADSAAGTTTTSSTLAFQYSLKDAEGSASVSTADARVVPVVLQASGARAALSVGFSCPTGAVDSSTGLGSCDVLVPPRWFPSSGATPVTVKVAAEVKVCITNLSL